MEPKSFELEINDKDWPGISEAISKSWPNICDAANDYLNYFDFRNPDRLCIFLYPDVGNLYFYLVEEEKLSTGLIADISIPHLEEMWHEISEDETIFEKESKVIIDKIKNTLKLSTEESIAKEKIDKLCNQSSIKISTMEFDGKETEEVLIE